MTKARGSWKLEALEITGGPIWGWLRLRCNPTANSWEKTEWIFHLPLYVAYFMKVIQNLETDKDSGSIWSSVSEYTV